MSKSDIEQIQPFLKWAGGKRGIMSELQKYFPEKFNNYYEPFIGGGAVLMELVSKSQLKKKVNISDISEPLIITYKTVFKHLKDMKKLVERNRTQYTWETQQKSKNIFMENKKRFNVLKGKVWHRLFMELMQAGEIEKMIENLEDMGDNYISCEQLVEMVVSSTDKSTLKKYLVEQIKKTEQSELPSLETCLTDEEKVELSVLFLYLNKTGFNGMYRENAYGVYNIPPGTYTNPVIFNWILLEKISKQLSDKISINASSYEKVLVSAEKDDFVYLDPPYDGDKMFTSYSKSSFDRKEQEKLKNCYDEMNKRGVKVMLSNSGTDFIKNLYKNYTVKSISTKRFLNSKSQDRKNVVEEVIIINF